MYFNKVSTPANYRFTEKNSKQLLTKAQKEFSFRIRDLGEDVFQLSVTNRKLWKANHSQATLSLDAFKAPSTASLSLSKKGLVTLNRGKEKLFESDPGVSFGVCGTKWMMGFLSTRQCRFYG
ncbi:MAG: hypothetical protein ACYTGH_19840, partial [Planctomycetota bacterium]